MTIIRITGTENKCVPYLFNRVMDVDKAHKCGGKYYLHEGNVELKAWSNKIAEGVKEALIALKIKFEEIKE